MPPTVRMASSPSRPAASRAAARSPASRGGRKRSASTPLGTSSASTPNSSRSRAIHGVETHEDAVGGDDRALLAGDQRRRAEVVDVVDGADDGVDDALVAQRQRRVGRDAVLGVDDVVAARRAAARAGPRCRRRSSRRCARRTARRGRRGRRRAPARAGARKKPVPGGPIANSSTSWPRAASAPATESACTTPPRGRTE